MHLYFVDDYEIVFLAVLQGWTRRFFSRGELGPGKVKKQGVSNGAKSKVKVKVVETLRVNISETKRAIEVIFSQIVIYSPLKSYALITDQVSRSVIRSRSF